jgi:hypothetical protein
MSEAANSKKNSGNPAHLSVKAEELRKQVLAYNNGSTTEPINVYKMHHDQNGGGLLASRLGRFAQLIPPYKRTASNALKHLGFTATRRNTNVEELREALRNYWKKEDVQKAYRNEAVLPTLGDLKKINYGLYQKLQKVGRKISMVEIINSLYKDFPDLHTYVRAQRSPLSRADPEIVSKQLMLLFANGEPISCTSLRNSPDPCKRTLYKRVASISSSKPHSKIVKELLPELSFEEINGNQPERIRKLGRISNLFVEFLLKWTKFVDASGNFYQDGFQSVFGAPLKGIFAERRISTPTGYLRPDFLVVENKNNAVEVKAGDNVLGSANELAKKYENGQGYAWNIGGTVYPLQRKVAVLLMPHDLVRQASSLLEDAGYTIAGGELIGDYLEILLDRLHQSPYHEHLARAAPRLHNPQKALTSAFDLLVQKPAVIARSRNWQLMSFVEKSLDALVHHEFEQQTFK